jgi:hypothetical protein
MVPLAFPYPELVSLLCALVGYVVFRNRLRGRSAFIRLPPSPGNNLFSDNIPVIHPWRKLSSWNKELGGHWKI